MSRRAGGGPGAAGSAPGGAAPAGVRAARAPELGVVLPTWRRTDGTYASWDELRRIALAAEELGIGAAWVPDHLLRTPAERPRVGFHECWTVLAAIAATTRTIALGPLVTCAGFRDPGLLAKAAATLDAIAPGRIRLGIGPGDPAGDASWTAFGHPVERPVRRYAEVVEAVAGLVAGGPVDLDGEVVRLRGAELLPAPASAIPLWLAGRGDRTLAIAARRAEVVVLDAPVDDLATAAAARDRIVTACADAGRDPGTLGIAVTVRLALRADGSATGGAGTPARSPAELAGFLRALGSLGCRHVTLQVSTDEGGGRFPALAPTALERLAPLVDELAAG